MRLAFAVTSVALVLTCGCATYRDQLARSQESFERNDHDHTLALLRDLEGDFLRLDRVGRAQYAYLRGMTDYRIGHRADARHWLALGASYEEASPGALPAAWKAETRKALEELNGVVYSEGFASLAAKRAADEPAK